MYANTPTAPYASTAPDSVKIIPAQRFSDTLPFGRLWYGEPNAVANLPFFALHFVIPLLASYVLHESNET
jgi:hypothetical protein